MLNNFFNGSWRVIAAIPSRIVRALTLARKNVKTPREIILEIIFTFFSFAEKILQQFFRRI